MRTVIVIKRKDFDLSTLAGIEACERSLKVVIIGGKDCGDYFQAWVLKSKA